MEKAPAGARDLRAMEGVSGRGQRVCGSAGTLHWLDCVAEARLTGPPAVPPAAVGTCRLGHRIRKTFVACIIDVDAGGKFTTRLRALQHQHSHGGRLRLPQRK